MPDDQKFASSVRENDYRQHVENLTLRRLRITCFIVLFLFLLDASFQYLSEGTILTGLFWIRLAAAIAIVVIFTLAYFKSFLRFAFVLSLIGTLIVAGDIEGAIMITGVYHSPFQTGLVLLVIAVALLFPYSVKQMAVTCGFIWIMFFMPIFITGKTIEIGGFDFLVSLFFLICSSLIALIASFMISRLRRHEFFSQVALKDTFGKYVANQIRDEVLSGRIPLDGEMKEVTILFADLRGFTPMTEAYDPKMVVKIMNSYFKEMAGAIQDQGGVVLQFIGDEIYAVFGAPIARSDHPAKAFQAALDMEHRLIALNKRFEEKGWPSLHHGIGIHTGMALAANIGSPDRLSYLLVGDTVVVASRLQSITKEVGTDMIVSGSTYARLPDEQLSAVSLRKMPPAVLKGKSEPVDFFALRTD